MRYRLGSIVYVFLPLLLLSASLASVLAEPGRPSTSFVPDKVLVAFQPGTAAEDILVAHSQSKGTVLRTLNSLGMQVVSVPTGTVPNAVAQYRRNPSVRFAEPDYIRPLFLPTTNEGSEPSIGILNNFDEQWGLNNTAQAFGASVDPIFGTLTVPAYSGAVDADIDAPEGWSLTHGSASVRIAVLDSGVSCSHVDLDSKCVEEVNFVAAHGSPLDDILGHGTHVAAIAAAETDNGVGTAGVAWESSIGSLKVCYEDYSLSFLGIIQGLCEDADIVDAIVYATDAGYDVINMSLAGPASSQALQTAVDYAWANNVVLVAGAGNNYSTEKQYPAAFDNVIAVAATDYFDNLAYFSTFSSDSDDWVAVAAPGHVVFSAVPGELCGLAPDDPYGCYDWKSGTSMATPVVSGVAAMLRSYLSNPTNAQVRAALENSADPVGALGQNMLAWTRYGRVNLFNALTYNSGAPGPGGGDTIAPVIENVTAANLNGPRFQVSWTTDEPATTVLRLTCCGDLSDPNLVTEHSVTVRGQKNVVYEYYVISTDAAGNQAMKGPYQFQN